MQAATIEVIFVQLLVAQLLRERLPDHIMSYTFPAEFINFPFRDVVQYGHQYFDTISAFRANEEAMQGLEQLGVPRNKVEN